MSRWRLEQTTVFKLELVTQLAVDCRRMECCHIHYKAMTVTYVVDGAAVEYHLPNRSNYITERTQDGDRHEVNTTTAGLPLCHFVDDPATCTPP